MAIRPAAASRNAALDALLARADGGSIEVRSGSQPADGDAAAAGTLLATVDLAADAFAAAAGGTATLDADPVLTGTGAADGTAGWFRVLTSGGQPVFDGSVPDNMSLNTTTISTGVDFSITAGSITFPAG